MSPEPRHVLKGSRAYGFRKVCLEIDSWVSDLATNDLSALCRHKSLCTELAVTFDPHIHVTPERRRAVSSAGPVSCSTTLSRLRFVWIRVCIQGWKLTLRIHEILVKRECPDVNWMCLFPTVVQGQQFLALSLPVFVQFGLKVLRLNSAKKTTTTKWPQISASACGCPGLSFA